MFPPIARARRVEKARCPIVKLSLYSTQKSVPNEFVRAFRQVDPEWRPSAFYVVDESA